MLVQRRLGVSLWRGGWALGWPSVRRLASQPPVPTFVSTDWLADNAEDPSVRIVHASWSSCEDFATARIPSARCFDGLACRDAHTPYKNMLPTEELFQDTAREMGVNSDSHVVVYDMSARLPSLDIAPRVWFMFRVFGHQRVSLLAGGMLKWLREQRPVREGPVKSQRTSEDFVARYQPSLVRSFDEVTKAVEESSEAIVDARMREVYEGSVEDPFGMEGHIKGASSVPLVDVLDHETGLPKCEKELRSLFHPALSAAKPIVFHCNTGLHACGVLAAAHSAGLTEAALYDGSWQEFAQKAKGREDCLLDD